MEPEKKSNGALVGLIIIIIILIIGGIYVWQVRKNSAEKNAIQSENITAEDSNNLNSLETDVNNTNTDTGVDVNAIY